MFNLKETLDNPFTIEELKKLNHELTTHGGLNIFQMQGFLCALISGPRILPSQTWMPVIWGEKREFESMEEIQALVNLVMRFNNQIADSLLKDEFFFPLVDYCPIIPFTANALNAEQHYHLQLWCEGYAHGIALDMDTWFDQVGEYLAMLLMPIHALSKKDASPEDLGIHFEQSPSKEELEEHRKEMLALLPKLIPTIYDFWRSDRRSKSVSHIKKGRNDPCLCGSRKKFKKCCGFKGTLH